MTQVKVRAKARKSQTRISQSRKRQQRPPLGRRPGNNPTDEIVLDAAEELFAQEGFGTSLRKIANKARVNESLLIHYFTNKNNLIATVFMRRAQILAQEHIKQLELLEARAEPPSLEDVIRAWLIPAYNMQRRSAGNAAFLKMSARLELETSADILAIRNQIWQGSMQRFTTALRRAAPHLDGKAVYWRTIFMIGAFLYTAFENHRIATLSDGLCDPRDADDAIAQFIPFLVGGMQKPA